MPGESHYTNGSAKFYALTNDVTKRDPEYIDAAVKLIEYLGGKYNDEFVIAKRWAAENGLGFAYAELYDDPDVASTFNAWGDVEVEREQEEKYSMSMEGMKTPWFTEFSEVIRREVHNVLSQTKTTLEALDDMANEWNIMREKYTK
jgi:ABC-type glycerol-3-phosphate transport system substrate-binding protein